jgi:ketosteroid isomerase-like protein
MKKNQKTLIVLCVILGIFYYKGTAQEKDIETPINSLIRNEKDFAKTCSEKGIKESFLTFLDDNSVLFDPRPMSGKKLYKDYKDGTKVLSWVPEYADISSVGDMGYTLGPWEFKKSPKDSASAFGHFVTIWHKQHENVWRALIDVGIWHKKASLDIKNIEVYQNLQKPDIKDLPYNDYLKERKKILEIEASFTNESIEKGISTAFISYAADKVHVFREGMYPLRDMKLIQELLMKEKKICSWKPIESNIALSGDLGYTYGILECFNDINDKSKIDSSSYVRIWRKNSQGNFKIALDILKSITDKK